METHGPEGTEEGGRGRPQDSGQPGVPRATGEGGARRLPGRAGRTGPHLLRRRGGRNCGVSLEPGPGSLLAPYRAPGFTEL